MSHMRTQFKHRPEKEPRESQQDQGEVYTSFFFLVSLGGVRLSPLGTLATVGLLYQPRISDDDYYGAVGGMRIGRGKQVLLAVFNGILTSMFFRQILVMCYDDASLRFQQVRDYHS
jgi:hypothetical protein